MSVETLFAVSSLPPSPLVGLPLVSFRSHRPFTAALSMGRCIHYKLAPLPIDAMVPPADPIKLAAVVEEALAQHLEEYISVQGRQALSAKVGEAVAQKQPKCRYVLLV